MTEIVERFTLEQLAYFDGELDWAEMRPDNDGVWVKYSSIGDVCAEITRLRAKVARADALADLVEGIIEGGCPRCGGDCSSANPPVLYCPQREAMQNLTAYREVDR